LVFNAWIDPDQIAVWCAPEGCEVPRDTVDIDPRPGGRIHFSMVDSTTGDVIPVRFEILELAKPDLLVLASEPQPELGLPHPMLTRVVFEADGDATRLTLTQGPHTEEMRRGAASGWASSLDKLERLLEGHD
jgi:uncharacterized protein YndB with AHSA1/START domain